MSAERRRYYRIDDEVMIAVSPLAKQRIDDHLEDFWANQHAFSIRNNLNVEIEQQLADRHKIENKLPELGRYLAVLEKQIGHLTDQLISDDAEQPMTRKIVSLSAQGIAYFDDQPLPVDELVELKLTLLPSGMRLVIIARVVKIEKDPDLDGPRISLEFEHLHEADREILIKHAHARQLESLSNLSEN
jgi:hypothetical protein